MRGFCPRRNCRTERCRKRGAEPCERVSRESRFCPSMQKFLGCEQSVLRLICKNIAVVFRTKNFFQKPPLRFDKLLRSGENKGVLFEGCS